LRAEVGIFTAVEVVRELEEVEEVEEEVDGELVGSCKIGSGAACWMSSTAR
jgi:hypothetical protein